MQHTHIYIGRVRHRHKDVLWLCHCHTCKWKVLCRNVYFIYICWNIHSSWQRQRKTKRKIRLNCCKWSKLQTKNKMWLLCRYFLFCTSAPISNEFRAILIEKETQNESAFLERHFQRLSKKTGTNRIVLQMVYK